MKYQVWVQEIWSQGYETEAESEEEARDKVIKAVEGIVAVKDVTLLEDVFEYIQFQDSDSWDVQEIKDHEKTQSTPPKKLQDER